uniref:J domain-containing protein n=1 Tax=Panagrolaimus davidi TaxID=227884 RepID=A0A914PQ56_9BILA
MNNSENIETELIRDCNLVFGTTNLYTILDITEEQKRNLTEDGIKRAYRKLSLIFHPDKNVNKTDDEKETAALKFNCINEARKILLDATKADLYDLDGFLIDEETPEEDNSGDDDDNETAPMDSYQSQDINDEEMDYSSNESDVDSDDYKAFSPDYEIRQLIYGKTKLITFYLNDRSKCYHYYLSKDKRYYCSKRQKENHSCSAILLKRSNGEQYIQMKNDHACEPVDYYDDEIVTITNFEIYQKQIGKELFIFADEDRSHFYQYYYVKQKKCYVCAQCRKNGKDTKAIINPKTRELEAEAFHQCEPQSYIPKIDASKYLLDKSIKGKPLLVVFADRLKKTCFKFHWHKNKSFYICNEKTCSISAKILKSSNGEKFVQMYKEHKCHV